MAETQSILTWTLVSECPIPNDVNNLLVEGEVAVAAYKTFRDSAIFTNKRLIVRDAQGLTGKKVEVYSLPYSSINMWSTENAGKLFDLNAEVELWTRAGQIKVNLQKGVDIRKLDMLIANALLK
ncbi:MULTISPECIES: PH domain-containing protein [Clostridium]|uniref:PH domain-containing protein n=1 Tax=Clostridium subterminale TaxID=1550 RepID=A0ABN1KWY1_CLOSU